MILDDDQLHNNELEHHTADESVQKLAVKKVKHDQLDLTFSCLTNIHK